MATPNEEVVGKLNSFLRGEISAVETYRQALDKITDPALRSEVNVTRARKLYPMDETPVPVKGFDYVPTRVTGGKGELDPQNRPVVDFNKVVAGQERGGQDADLCVVAHGELDVAL